MIIEQQLGPSLPHVPDHVIAEHAEEDMGPDPVGEAMVDGTDLEIDGLDGPKRALDPGESLVSEDSGRGVEHRGGEHWCAARRRDRKSVV